jgi:hypothetical protein
MERILFFNSENKVIAKVNNVSEMDFVTIFDHLTKEELHAIKLAYVEFCEMHITYEDITDNNNFEDYLCDDSIAEGTFYIYEEIEETEEITEKQGLTIRQLYEMAKKTNALDIPINWSYTCSDDWYSMENEPLTNAEVDITNTEVNFYL